MGKILQDVMVAMIKDRKRCYEVKQWAPFVQYGSHRTRLTKSRAKDSHIDPYRSAFEKSGKKRKSIGKASSIKDKVDLTQKGEEI